MSKAFDIARMGVRVIEHDEDVVDILLTAIDMDEEEFEYEWNQTPLEYVATVRNRK